MPSGDIRYKYIASVYNAGDLKTLGDMFNLVPRSIVATDLGLNYDRFSKKVLKPELLTFRDVFRLSKLTNIEFVGLSSLIAREVQMKAEKKGSRAF